jgi:trimethylamine:corrinoid methyltransferase-like protein
VVMRGVADDDGALALDVVREVSQGTGSFIEHETTLRHFRENAWDPPLFSHIGLKASSGTRPVPPLAERAREKAQQCIAAGDYVLPESDRRILDTIYRRAAQRAPERNTWKR